MPFNRNDIYTSSGSVKLYNSWTPYVSKFDTSSFYNWEQDNLPLYDLEERTYELWEQAGFATSAGVPGLALTVSADAPASVLAANRNVFTTLSACIAAIPKVVRFPVLVEVGNFGDLGKLELHNFRIEENGSIEIINRAFSRAVTTSSIALNALPNTTFNPSINSFIRVPRHLYAVDATEVLLATSCVNIQTPVLSATTDVRCQSGGSVMYTSRHDNRTGALFCVLDNSAVVDIGNSRYASGTVCPEEIGITGDSTIGILDFSATRQTTQIIFPTASRRNVFSGDKATGNIYLNYLSKISVKNCDGPIYIRNFIVNGKGSVPNGIDIVNSDVVLENCSAARCQEAGFKFNNSKVILSRSAYAYRNYKLTSTTTRQASTGYGFHIINSDVTLSSNPIAATSTSVGDTGGSNSDAVFKSSKNFAGFVLENSKLRGGITRSSNIQASSCSVLASELNTGYGMLLQNSVLEPKGLVDLFCNNIGIDAEGTTFKFEELCVELHNNEGLIAKNSNFVWVSPNGPTNAGQDTRLQIDFLRNGQHISLINNSYFGFSRTNSIPTIYGNSKFNVAHGVIRWGGANKCNLPAISVDQGSMLDLLHPNIGVDSSTDVIASVPSYGRALKVTNSSKASLFGSKTGCNFVYGPSGITNQSKMAGIYADNNSQVNIHGPTAMAQFGVDVLVENNSVLNIEPPRVRDAYGLEVSAFNLNDGENHTAVELHATRACLVANKNSTININDLGAYPANWRRGSLGPTYLGFGSDYPIDTYDVSAYTSSGCLQFYPNPQDTTAIGAFYLDALETTVGAGGLGFTAPTAITPTYPTFTAQTGLLQYFVVDNPLNGTTNFTSRSKITQGGVCVRATDNSIVNVKNVHFPVGTNSSPLDGFYYTTSGSDCDRFMIWNIADKSRLNASFLSVSGMHPSDSQYHGPSAIWVSSVNGISTTNVVPASGAPAGTPDTGSLSILDIFGAGSSVWILPSGLTINNPFNAFYTFSGTLNTATIRALGSAGINYNDFTRYPIGVLGSYANTGPFRIYWSPKPSARVLQNDSGGFFKGAFPYATGGSFSGVVGAAYQIFAQGYNCSAPLSAVVPTGATNASGAYPDLLKFSHDSNSNGIPDKLWTSGFYYCNEMLEENPTQCMLDESAAKAFANAQNASVGLAGKPKKVTIYSARSNTSLQAESYIGNVSGSIGFKSASIFDLSRDN